MTGLTDAERAELRERHRQTGHALSPRCGGHPYDEDGHLPAYPCDVVRALDALEAAEQRTADLIAAVDGWIRGHDNENWQQWGVPQSLRAAIAPFRTPPTIRTGDSTIHTDLAEQP